MQEASEHGTRQLRSDSAFFSQAATAAAVAAAAIAIACAASEGWCEESLVDESC